MKGTFYNWIIACLIAIPMWCGAQVKPNDDPARNLQKFSQFYRYLNGMYIDTVHNAALIESAIRSVLSQLDPHSTYITAEEMVSVKETFGGSFSGIGIEFNILNDTIIVVNVISGGPSEKVGLQPNDKIIAVDGKPSIGGKQTDVPKLLRGPKGTQVSLTVARHGEQEPLEFLIVRDNIPINTVDAADMVNPTTGYVRVNRFADNTYRELFEAVEKMDKPEALILDLRNNGGGTMDAAIAMSNFFLPQGSLIISTEGMKVPTSRYAAKVDGIFTKGKDDSTNQHVKQYLMTELSQTDPSEVDWCMGAALLLRNPFYKQLKGFDEGFFLYVEDMDICHRCWNLGKKVIYLPSSKMIHAHQRSSQKINRKTFLHLKSMLYFFRKNRFKINR